MIIKMIIPIKEDQNLILIVTKMTHQEIQETNKMKDFNNLKTVEAVINKILNIQKKMDIKNLEIMINDI
jgi:hypothetical protein